MNPDETSGRPDGPWIVKISDTQFVMLDDGFTPFSMFQDPEAMKKAALEAIKNDVRMMLAANASARRDNTEARNDVAG